MEIGFIGLGAMGRAMAARLLSAGHRLRVWNRSPGPARELAGQGAEAVAAAAEAFRGDVAITMLADDAAWIYGWADQWTLSADQRRVESYGTPVIVFGKYDYGKQAPWKHLATDYSAASVTGTELMEAIQHDLPIIQEMASVN